MKRSQGVQLGRPRSLPIDIREMIVLERESGETLTAIAEGAEPRWCSHDPGRRPVVAVDGAGRSVKHLSAVDARLPNQPGLATFPHARACVFMVAQCGAKVYREVRGVRGSPTPHSPRGCQTDSGTFRAGARPDRGEPGLTLMRAFSLLTAARGRWLRPNGQVVSRRGSPRPSLMGAGP